MSEELVKLLRSMAGDRHDYGTRWYRNPDGHEAADRIEQLEAALREIKGWNDNQNRRSLKIAAVIDAALAGEKKEQEWD